MVTFNGARRARFAIVLGLLVSLMMPFAAQTGFSQSAGKTTVYPGAVSVQPGTCTDGVATAAIVSVPSDTLTDGIFYTITQPDDQGSFEVHAQVGDTFIMGDTSGTGWDRTNEWNAYYRDIVPVPDCDGPVPGETTNTPDPDPGIVVSAMPLDCGSIPYPAPTGSDVTNSIVFSNFAIIQNGVVHTGGPISLSSPVEELTLTFDWASIGAVSAGQYFRFAGPLDTNGNKVFASATQYFPVLNTGGTAQAGCATVVNGDITVQFTGYVDPLNSVDGGISIDLVMAAGSMEEANTIEFTFDDTSTFAIEIPGTPSGEFAKRGWFERPDQGLVENLGSVGWQLHVPASPNGYTNLVLHDSAPADGSWNFSCAGEVPTNITLVALDGRGRPVALEYSEACDAAEMTLAIAAVPAGTTIDFYFTVDLAPGAEGPFYNIATAQADNLDVIELPYEVERTVGRGVLDGDFAVTPIPPAINHAVCVDNVWQPASVTLPTDQPGVVYSMSPNPFPAEGGYLVVTASLEIGYTWATGADISGWVLNDDNTMIFEAEVLNTPCEVPTETPPTETATPPTEEPCIPPVPEECTPPPGENETPVPCETPTIPAWCMETPTPPTVTDLPDTGTTGSGSGSHAALIISAATSILLVAVSGAAVHKLRAQS